MVINLTLWERCKKCYRIMLDRVTGNDFKFLTLQIIRIDTYLKDLENNVLETNNKMFYLQLLERKCLKHVIKEQKLRRTQVKAVETRVNDKLESKHRDILKTIDDINELEKQLKLYMKKIKFLGTLEETLDKKYIKYLTDFRKMTTDLEETHGVTRRLASLETRITKMEIKSHGISGETASRSIRTDQD